MGCERKDRGRKPKIQDGEGEETVKDTGGGDTLGVIDDGRRKKGMRSDKG